MDRSRHAGDDSRGHRPVVRRVDVDSDGYSVRVRVDAGTYRTETLGEYARSTTMKQAERLLIAVDWEGADDALWCCFEDFDAHSLMQGRVDVGPVVHDWIRVGHKPSRGPRRGAELSSVQTRVLA
jgi:hypothetical protein